MRQHLEYQHGQHQTCAQPRKDDADNGLKEDQHRKYCQTNCLPGYSCGPSDYRQGSAHQELPDPDWRL